MDVRDFLIQQYDFVIWADERCLRAAASAPIDRYRHDYGFSFGSVHNVLVHMIGAQQTWLGRFHGVSTMPYPDPADFADLEAVSMAWGLTHLAFTEFVREQTPASLEQRLEFARRGTKTTGVLWMLLTHVMDHATHHRGQLNSLIKLAGGAPLDYGYVTRLRILEGQVTPGA